MSKVKEPWLVKWELLIDRIGKLIEREGRKMVVMNIEAMQNPKNSLRNTWQRLKRLKRRLK